MSIDRGSVRGLVRAVAYDVRGARIGRVAQVFLDDRTDEPAWVAVDVIRTRGMRLLPLAGAGLKGRHLVIRAERTTIRSAPRIDLGDGQLSTQDESRLLAHYGLSPSGLTPSAGEQPPGSEDLRPASPWPDDTERETAWERPAQAGHGTHDTQAFSPGWDQRTGDQQTASPVPATPKPAPAQQTPTTPPTAQGTASQPSASPSTVRQPAVGETPPPQGSGGIGDRGINRPGVFAPAASGPAQPDRPTEPSIPVRQPEADPPRSDPGTQARPAL